MKKPPIRNGKYTKITPVRQAKRGVRRRFNWFWRLSRKKKIVVIAAPILLIMILVPLITYVMYANDIADKERLMNRNNTGIILLDQQGKEFYSEGRAGNRALVPLSQISDSMKKALIASEDKDFYTHGGFNLLSIVRAAFTRYGGGSTITQQLAKNTLLSDEHSLFRKYQELAMSVAIEQTYSKDDILDMYLNSVYYGENSFGIQEAAKVYFGTTPDKLDLAQSAMLVGLLPAPSAYSPISGNAQFAKERQTTVLTRMVTTGVITEADKQAALGEQLKYVGQQEVHPTKAPHFVQMVKDRLYQQYGEDKVMRSGYQIKTTLDLGMQDTLEASVAANMAYIQANGGSNAGAIIIDPKSGEIRALVGSADWSNAEWGKVNMATTARQPGSSFKPIYYAKALDNGVITPATMLADKVKDFGGYIPRDADRNENSRGRESVRRAISMSLNIPSVEVMQSYGIDRAIQGARELGITTLKDDASYGLPLALGSAETRLDEMTNAYAAFANGGQQYDTAVIHEINDKFNKQIYINKPQSHTAISPVGAFLISSILSDNAARAPIFGSSLTVAGRTAAVKTGTTNDSRDAWTIGYTPSLAVGVWVGNNDNRAMRNGGSGMAGPIWRKTMQQLLAADEKFTVPGNIVQKYVCTANGGLASGNFEGTYQEYFRADALPTTTCDQPKTVAKIQVCNTTTKQIETIDEDAFDSTTQSKDITACQAPTDPSIQVCDLASGKITNIQQSQFDATKYSMDATSCQPAGTTTAPTTVQACDTTTGRVVMVPQAQIDGTRYTANVANCKKAP